MRRSSSGSRWPAAANASLSGTFELDDAGRLILRGMWIARELAEARCGHRFVRR